MRKVVYIAIGILPMFMIAFTPERSSSGAPGSHTGAPGEKTCAASGCHDDNSINSGTASVSIDLGGATNYLPGNTYPVKIKITDANVVRFGFQIVALDNNNMNAGTFVITNSNTQIIKNDHAFTDRDYVTYTFSGTDATAPGTAEWTVNWVAPATANAPVTFYAGLVSANDDMSDKGDRVYTTSKTLNN